MPGQFMTGFIQQTLKGNALLSEAALQGPSAEVQLSCEILYSGTLTGEYLFQNAFCLLGKSLLRELLRELRLQLRRDSREQVSVVSDKWEFYIGLAEYQDILRGLELYRATEMRLVHFSMRGRALKLDSLGM